MSGSESFNPPLQPRRSGPLKVLIVTRISTINQNEMSLDDQAAMCERRLRAGYGGPIEIMTIGGRGSGEILDRVEFLDLMEKIDSEQYDLVLTEDLGRICRRLQAMEVCEGCIDKGTRLIAINDQVDTAQESWHLNGFFAVMRHQMYNGDTAKRIRRSQRNRFQQGGILMGFPWGYVKPSDAKLDSEVSRDPVAIPIYDEWFDRLEQGASFSEVADWLNAAGVPTGPCCRRRDWTSHLVAEVTYNTVLKGLRHRNTRMSKRINRTGRRKSVKAPPEEKLERHCPHLAHIEPARYDRVVRMLKQRNGGRGRKSGTQKYARKRSRWPGDHLTCGICGRLMYWGGHGQTTRLMCSGSREYRCWNPATCDGIEAAPKIIEAVLTAAEQLTDWDAELAASLSARVAEESDGRAAERSELVRKREAVGARVENLIDTLESMGRSSAIEAKMRKLEEEQESLQFRLDELDRRPAAAVTLPTIEELRRRAREATAELAADDPGFGRIMKTLVPVIEIVPVRPFDGGQTVVRAVLTVELAALSATPLPHAVADLIRRTVTIDLFDPPQRIEHLAEVKRLRAAGVKERIVAERLGITQTAVQRTMSLARQLAAAGLTDPYVALTEPPEDDGKLRRSRHPRYRFEPLPHKRLEMPQAESGDAA